MEYTALECAEKLGVAIVADGEVIKAVQAAIMTSGPIDLVIVKQAIAAGIVSALCGADSHVWLAMLAGVLNANENVNEQHWYCDSDGRLDYHNMIDDQYISCISCGRAFTSEHNNPLCLACDGESHE